MKKTLFAIAVFVAAILTFTVQSFGQSGIKGTVKDPNGAVVPGAAVTISNAEMRVSMQVTTDRDGEFSFNDLAAGDYQIRVVAAGFSAADKLVSTPDPDLVITLAIGESRAVVSAEIGRKEEIVDVPQAVSLISSEMIAERATSVLAQVGEEEAGLNVQRTSPTIGAIVVRGLTGKNVANFVDGVRFTHAGQRGGINTFFNLNEPTTLQSIEVLRGPNGAQYGSDSLSGTVNLLTKSPVYGLTSPEWHGEFTPGFTTSDRSYGSSALISYGTQEFGGYVNISGRRIGDLRTADGRDSHSAITRFLGLPSTTLYDVNPDTNFQQYGIATRFNYAPRDESQLIFFYQRSQQDDGKRFDQLVGGDGNLIADLRNLMLDFGYLRYVEQGFGPFDGASFTLSYNSQREERVNQGGQGNPVGDITHQYERTSTWGGSFFLDKQLGKNNSFLVGGDYYAEHLNSPGYVHNPATNAVTVTRAGFRVPDGASFKSGGVFVQDQWDAIPNRLRITGALRYGGMSYRVRASDSPIVNGAPLWSDDELTTSDLSGRIGTVVRPTQNLRIAFNYGRGFRYPSMTDLGTLGLTGDGFEVDHITAAAFNGHVGTTAGANAVSTGLIPEKQRSEFSNSFDGSVRYQRQRFDTEFTVFRMDIVDSIVKQALILPAGALGQSIGGQTITGQAPGGAVFVAAATNPVLIRTNFSEAKIWGIEFENEARLRSDLTFKANFTYIRAEDKATGLPPNIEGGTPPPNAFLSLRYNGGRFWIEPYTTLAYRQERLSSLDLSDRRTGAARTRAQIQNYFRRGACVLGLTTPGTTGACGSAGGTLVATGETLAQVQARMLPGVALTDTTTAVPLFTALPGYGLVNIRGGITINEKAKLFWAFENILDQYYRNPSWGIDGAGRSFTAQLRLRF
jgi:hemoglobin/transferrin/lactoferrin receptor protein